MRRAAAITTLVLAIGGVVSAQATRPQIHAIEDARDPSAADLAVLTAAARGSADRRMSRAESVRALDDRRAALLALGRMERRELIPLLRSFLLDAELRATAELALLLTVRAHGGDQPDAAVTEAVDDLLASASIPAVLGHLPLTRADQLHAADARLRSMLGSPHGPRAAAARALEALARRNRRLGSLDETTLALLKKGATRQLPAMPKPEAQEIVLGSIAALVSAGVVDEDVVEAALGEESAEVRRLGAVALTGGGASLDPSRRTELLRSALADRSPSVRYEALRGWGRHASREHGCAPIVDALADEDMHVALAAIDALAERCPEDEAITVRLASELRVPPNIGPWHRPAHALVAVAHRAPDQAAIALPWFMRHATWQLRMYAARAATVLKNAESLATLAYDANDNVREAALAPLRALTGSQSDAAFVAALGRTDHQLLRTAAAALANSTPTRQISAALAGALDRLTAQRKETSRDTRLALLERLLQLDGANQVPLLERLLTDYDAKLASEAALALERLTGTRRTPSPRPLPRPPPPSLSELEQRLVARVDLDTGRFFQIAFDKSVAPLAYARLARLIREGYFNGLTFHRVAPNFVVQGGSPGANEYEGSTLYMRDEIGYLEHRPGTFGLSTRGRDTGDAQVFINLVDNMRLDFDYTVFGRLARAEELEVVNDIQEGTAIVRIQLLPPAR